MTGPRKKITLQRLLRNFGRIAKSLTPPVLHRLLPKETNGPPIVEDTAPVVEFELPTKSPNEIWPGFNQTEVKMSPMLLRDHLWAMPENEILVLATICQLLQPSRILEFGTFTGASTLAMALNSAADTQIVTYDIAPEQRREHRTGVGSDIPFDFQVGQAFHDTSYARKIEQRFANTLELNSGQFEAPFDLVFVDADHTYSFAKNDTQLAESLLAPAGVILWHDYRWDEDAPECAGVTRCVNEFQAVHGDCFEIAGTRFAVYLPGHVSEKLDQQTKPIQRQTSAQHQESVADVTTERVA